MGNIFPLEISLLSDAEETTETPGRLRAKYCLYLGGGPKKVISLPSFTVGIQGRVESSLPGGHLSFHISEYFSRRLPEKIVLPYLECVYVGYSQQCLVVEHLLEMGDKPLPIDAVAVKPIADLVAD